MLLSGLSTASRTCWRLGLSVSLNESRAPSLVSSDRCVNGCLSGPDRGKGRLSMGVVGGEVLCAIRYAFIDRYSRCSGLDL